jgi:hypothetical protein
MCIGIIYDAYTNDSWYKIDKDVYSVKLALKAVRLPLPVAGIFDTLKGDFIELDENYRRYRPELMEKAKIIFYNYVKERPAGISR